LGHAKKERVSQTPLQHLEQNKFSKMPTDPPKVPPSGLGVGTVGGGQAGTPLPGHPAPTAMPPANPSQQAGPSGPGVPAAVDCVNG
jgi:hypothetical protein